MGASSILGNKYPFGWFGRMERKGVSLGLFFFKLGFFVFYANHNLLELMLLKNLGGKTPWEDEYRV